MTIVVEPEVAAPSADNPVTAVAWIEPRDVSAGGHMELHVRIRVAEGHYLYGPVASGSPFTQTSVQLQPSDAAQPIGSWTAPTADTKGHLQGVVEFRRTLRASATANPGTHELQCTLNFQACNEELCWPPRNLNLKATFEITPKTSQ